MITTLTLNPSTDRTALVERLQVGEVQRVLDSRVEPGGKGVNIARALATNGCAAAAIFPGDAASAADFRAELDPLGVACQIIGRAQTTRSNLTITGQDGTTTKLNERGDALDPSVLDQLIDATVAAEAVGLLAAAGSLPDKAAPDTYARLAGRLQTPDKSLAVDTSGAALKAMVGAPCRVAKPNLEELQSLVDAPLRSLGEVVDAATELQRLGWEAVLVSLGADGATLVDRSGVYHGRSEVDAVRNTVGAGDALLAGYLSSSEPGATALAEALAWSHAAVTSIGTAAPAVKQQNRVAVALSPSLEPNSPLTEVA